MLSSISNYLTPTGDLVLKEKELTTLPKCISSISNSIIALDLRSNNITHLNSVLSTLTHLRALDLRCNTLETLTEDIASLIHLKVLRLDNNSLTTLPYELFTLTSLCILTLNRNSLYSLQSHVACLKNLETLVLSSNQLKSLPGEISHLKKLKLFYIHGNEFTAIPSSLCKMSALAEFSLEWFRYCVPPLPRVLKHKIGEAIIDSLRAFCGMSLAKGQADIDLLDFIKHFSEGDFEINRVDLRNRNALHIAVLSGDNGVIQGLLEAGCPLNELDVDGFSPFVLALKENNIKAANTLLDAGANLQIGGGCFGSPLNIAVVRSEPKLVLRLLEAGISPNLADFRGNTCLHSLIEVFDKCKHRNSLIGDVLLSYGAEVNKENGEKWTAIHLAAKEKQTGAIKWMKKKNRLLGLDRKEGFNFNKQGGTHGWTALHLASHSGDYDTVEVLVKAGANPAIKNYDGRTAKDTSRCNLALFKYLTRAEKACYLYKQSTEIDPSADFASKKTHESNKICEEYKIVYDAFAYGDREELEELIQETENTIVKADSIYLVSLFKQKKSSKMLYKAKKNKDPVIKSEVTNAMNFIKDIEYTSSQSMSNLKLTRTITPQTSMPNLLEFVEEETRVDTLLLI